MADRWDNPMGLDGFEFVEFTAPEPEQLATVFAALGFSLVGRHRSKAVTRWRQGDINFILNAEPEGVPGAFSAAHGPSVNAIAFRVANAAKAHERALALGARAMPTQAGPGELAIPALEGVGGSALYLVDRYGGQTIYDVDFEPTGAPDQPGAGLTAIDHLTHNLRQGQMDHWNRFYGDLFAFRESQYFDIQGQLTGLRSRALTAPDGKIRIPLNEGGGDGQMDQIEEFIAEFNGEGVQHIALATDDIFAAVRRLKALGMSFQAAPPAAYYEMLDQRLPGHGQDVAALQAEGILVDGKAGGKLLLQIFTQACIGPIFFEIIQRKGDEGFGAGNFKALFESLERDQIQRGVIGAR